MAHSSDSRAPRAVFLFSGGLDSILGAELLLRLGVEVTLLRRHSIFFPPREEGYAPDCPALVREVSEEMLGLVRNPHYGFGKNMNPCLDCKEMMYGKAWQEAGRIGADFVATGEVLGQRPMSQREDAFRRMEKGAGLVGKIVRPLSGRLLPESDAERQGLIDRNDLLALRGRSRKEQMALAQQWGIQDYPSPAGGCRLTDPQFAGRVAALTKMGLLSVPVLRAVRHGRFFPLDGGSFALVGRNHEDNQRLERDAPAGALLLRIEDRPGPLACLIGAPSTEVGTGPSIEALTEAKRLVVRYSRFDDLPLSQVQVARRRAEGEGP